MADRGQHRGQCDGDEVRPLDGLRGDGDVIHPRHEDVVEWVEDSDGHPTHPKNRERGAASSFRPPEPRPPAPY